MNPDLLLKFMSQDVPWSFGLRETMNESLAMLTEAPVSELPFFASKGFNGMVFKVVGADLEECLQKCLDHQYTAEVITPPHA